MWASSDRRSSRSKRQIMKEAGSRNNYLLTSPAKSRRPWRATVLPSGIQACLLACFSVVDRRCAWTTLIFTAKKQGLIEAFLSFRQDWILNEAQDFSAVSLTLHKAPIFGFTLYWDQYYETSYAHLSLQSPCSLHNQERKYKWFKPQWLFRSVMPVYQALC